MKNFWKNYRKYIIEFVLILSSVVMGFWVDDYRQNREDKRRYITTLLNFRNDLHSDIKDFRIMSDSIEEGLATKQYHKLQKIDSILNDDDLKNDIDAFILYQNEIGEWDDWRTESPYYNLLIGYGKFVQDDSLIVFLSKYEAVMKLEFEYWKSYNEAKIRFDDSSFAKFNYLNIGDIANLPLAQSNSFKFTIRKLMEISEYARQADLLDASNFSVKILEIDARLTHYGIDTSRLDYNYLLK